MYIEQLDKLNAKLNSIEINKVVNIKADELKIINGNIYAYLIDNSIKVYDCKTFKEIAILKLPFERKKQHLEILENEIEIIFADSKLYFYKINLKESQLSFLHYLSKILNFCYLKKRKELFLLTQIESEKPTGIVRSNLLGNILFINKKRLKFIMNI